MKRHPACRAPLIKVPYLFTGETTTSHINGKRYWVKETSYHWDKTIGYVYWVTNEDECSTRDNLDTDYCTSFSPKAFWKNFTLP